MLSYGAGFALWTALALTKVSGWGWRWRSSPLAGRSPERCGGDGGGRAGLPRIGTQRGRGWRGEPGAGWGGEGGGRPPAAGGSPAVLSELFPAFRRPRRGRRRDATPT